MPYFCSFLDDFSISVFKYKAFLVNSQPVRCVRIVLYNHSVIFCIQLLNIWYTVTETESVLLFAVLLEGDLHEYRKKVEWDGCPLSRSSD